MKICVSSARESRQTLAHAEYAEAVSAEFGEYEKGWQESAEVSRQKVIAPKSKKLDSSQWFNFKG